MITLTAYAAPIVLYYAVGIAAWRVAQRYGINGETRLLIYAWPLVALLVAVGAWSVIAAMDDMDETLDDRAQMGPTPIWIPLLLTLLVILAIVLNELLLHIVPTRGPLAAEYASDPTPQLALLAVAVATVALTKVVGWYRGRSADG